jgi:3-mercaptopyruvate sulfurtransferase SseA
VSSSPRDSRWNTASPIYGAKHIPGALNVDAMTYGGKEKPAEETERLFQSWGVSPEKRIVMYDQGGTFMATRLLFSLLYHGFPAKNLVILDGGMAPARPGRRTAPPRCPSPPD